MNHAYWAQILSSSGLASRKTAARSAYVAAGHRARMLGYSGEMQGAVVAQSLSARGKNGCFHGIFMPSAEATDGTGKNAEGKSRHYFSIGKGAGCNVPENPIGVERRHMIWTPEREVVIDPFVLALVWSDLAPRELRRLRKKEGETAPTETEE